MRWRIKYQGVLMASKCGAIALVCVLSGTAVASDEDDVAPIPRTIRVELVDSADKPVAGADIGIAAGVGVVFHEAAAKDGTEWKYFRRARSNAAGVAELVDDDERLELACIVARHETRKIVAIASFDPTLRETSLKLVLQPEHEVACRANCPELAAHGRDISGVVVRVRLDGKNALDCGFETRDFSLRLPPGEYEIQARADTTHQVIKTIHVSDDDAPRAVSTFALPATKLALLEGDDAPGLTGIVAWKNGDPGTLAALRGKVVILDFWGYWCNPCVGRMPGLFELYDKYRDQGLMIIGVHVDLGENEQEPVDTAARLDARLVETRKELWKGRDLPFPVALVKGERTLIRDGVEHKAHNSAVSDYDIVLYPTQVLIDRHGKVVGGFEPDEEGTKLLEKLLSEK
jgi:thiol-disulfide isomerase/thioredoxin